METYEKLWKTTQEIVRRIPELNATKHYLRRENIKYAPRVPIRLEHVMRALESQRALLKERYIFDSKGYIEKWNFITSECIEQTSWEYEKPLHKQDKDTIEVIYKLIFKTDA